MWFLEFIRSSIGKKFVMASTGLLLLLFLCIHAAGNAIVFFGSTAFQTYADTLHAIPLVVLVFSLGIFVVLLLHIIFGLYLFFQNRKEGDSRYAVSVRTVQNSFASKTMHWSGLFILFFILVHLAGFSFPSEEIKTSLLVKERLSNIGYGLFYVLSFGVLGLHLSHGFWSMLQTFGINHPRYNNLIRKATYAIPVLFFILFASVAFYFMTGLGAQY